VTDIVEQPNDRAVDVGRILQQRSRHCPRPLRYR
jgi:hypothetical protein